MAIQDKSQNIYSARYQMRMRPQSQGEKFNGFIAPELFIKHTSILGNDKRPKSITHSDPLFELDARWVCAQNHAGWKFNLFERQIRWTSKRNYIITSICTVRLITARLIWDGYHMRLVLQSRGWHKFNWFEVASKHSNDVTRRKQPLPRPLQPHPRTPNRILESIQSLNERKYWGRFSDW